MTYKKLAEKDAYFKVLSLQIICRKSHHGDDYPHHSPISCLPATQQAGKPLQNTESETKGPLEK
jgi:hypothetical protein